LTTLSTARDRAAQRRQRAGVSGPAPRVAVVHDYLSQRGGAERVVLSMMKAFPEARLITSVYEPSSTFPEFADYAVETTWLDRVARFRQDPRLALPLLAPTFSSLEIRDVDVVVCSTSGWAHAVSTAAPKLVYCHSPARWLYESDDYFAGLGSGARRAATGFLRPLRRWDGKAAASADRYLVNSSVVQDRLNRAYGRYAPVVSPPVSLGPSPVEPVPGLEPGFLLVVSRRRGYKQVDIVCEAVRDLPDERLVVVGGLPVGMEDCAPGRTTGLTNVPDAQMRWLYANCAALVATSNEDFGLTPVEANAAGSPAIVLRRGGYLDSSVEGLTGVFVEEATRDGVVDAVRRFRELSFDRESIRRHAAQFSESRFIARLRLEVDQLTGGGSSAAGGIPETVDEPASTACAS
jgi:glycosyltransferase involved in cell wall biosynthesis